MQNPLGKKFSSYEFNISPQITLFDCISNVCRSVRPENVSNDYNLKERDSLVTNVFDVLLLPKTEINDPSRTAAADAIISLAYVYINFMFFFIVQT